MSEEVPSAGKELAKFLAENIEQLVKLGTKAYNLSETKVRARLTSTFDKYSTEFWKRYSRGRSFFVREESDIYSFYVHLPVQHGAFITPNGIPRSATKKSSRIVEPKIADLFGKRNSVVVTGTGGSGKSMLVRHLVLNCLVTGYGVPVFIELRNLTELEFPSSLEDFLFETLGDMDLKLSKDLLSESLSLGHFVVVLDGFDELPETQQQRGSVEIQRFATRFPKSRVLVTSRPDEMFSSWHGFDNFTMAPLNREEAINFVQMQNYDEALATMFRKELEGDGFEKHRSFLSNPLLLTIMMLTYGQSASIPEKLGEFYENAFEALFQRHDVLKGGYTRPRSSKLDFSDFGRVFSAFCIHSYSDRCFTFTADLLNRYVDRAKETTQLSFSTECFIRDSVKAVCLLADEGLKKVFAHRSFQEYFAAKFIACCPDEIAVKLLEVAEPRLGYDRLHVLVHELNPGMFESRYLGPRLLKVESNIGSTGTVGIKAFTRFLKQNYDSINFEPGRLAWSCRGGSGKNFEDHRILTLTARIGFVKIDGISDALIKRYSGNGETSFDVSELTFQSSLVKDLFASNGIISKAGLEASFKIGKDLIARGKLRENSLASVLASFTNAKYI